MKIKKTLIPCIYSLIQIIILFCLRQFYLVTVFQTVACYAAVCALGIILWKAGPSVRDSYLVLWSGFHGVIVLGFMTCGTYYLTLTQVTFIQLVNIFLGFAVYWFFYVMTGRAVATVGCGNLFVGFVGTVNHYLVRFRGAPFQLSDFSAIKTAGNVVRNYNFAPNLLLILALLDLVLWYIVWRIGLSAEQKVKRWNWCMISGTIVIGIGCIALPIMKYPQIYAKTNQFAQDCYLADFAAEVMGNTQMLPEEYSVTEVLEIVEEFERFLEQDESEELCYKQPNIVVIMNESFSDLRVLGEFETTKPVLDFWDSLGENCIRGWTNVSVLGGSTANSEYEFLTSDAVALYPNTIPYNKYFANEDKYPGLVSIMEQLGYETTVFHPYLSSGWNRRQVYHSMGFDRMIFAEDLEEKQDTLRLYTSDKGDYDYIMQYFEEKDADMPQFFFNITMQNHGGYTYRGEDFETTVQLVGDAKGRFPQAEQYLSLMKASDDALKELLEFFASYEEPTIVVVFGDHQPRLEDGFYEYVTGTNPSAWDLEQQMRQYKTPFIIWHNYEAESREIGDVSLNFLASVLMESMELPMSEYQQFVLQQYRITPVMTAVGMCDAAGNLYAKGSPEYEAAAERYRLLVYNHTVDRENRVEKFFALNLKYYKISIKDSFTKRRNDETTKEDFRNLWNMSRPVGKWRIAVCCGRK